jgi:hypothetical protein
MTNDLDTVELDAIRAAKIRAGREMLDRAERAVASGQFSGYSIFVSSDDSAVIDTIALHDG